MGGTELLLTLLLATNQATADKPLATVETRMQARAELTECRAVRGKLTLRIRLTAQADTRVDLPYQETWIEAANRRYEILRDPEDVPLASPHEPGRSDRIGVALAKGETAEIFWRFPAPPPGTEELDFVLPNSERFVSVPIARE